MRALALLVLMGLATSAAAQQRPAEIDPNTKIQGGADVRGSGAAAGAGARSDDKLQSEPPPKERDEESRPESRKEDKPTTPRKPGERELQEPEKGDPSAR